MPLAQVVVHREAIPDLARTVGQPARPCETSKLVVARQRQVCCVQNHTATVRNKIVENPTLEHFRTNVTNVGFMFASACVTRGHIARSNTQVQTNTCLMCCFRLEDVDSNGLVIKNMSRHKCNKTAFYFSTRNQHASSNPVSNTASTNPVSNTIAPLVAEITMHSR